MQLKMPTPNGGLAIEAVPGKPIIFLGPNGTGKSRLGIYLDDLDSSSPSHRISAQRSLELPDEIFTDRYDRAIEMLRRDKSVKRTRTSPGSMEFDYDQLLIALFAERRRALEQAHEKSQGKTKSVRPVTAIDRLQLLWTELVPHQKLQFSESTVLALRTDYHDEAYEASEMSDGERFVLYLLGQVLLLEHAGLIIVDEPELHMSRALLGRLWDLAEQCRPDCAFIYITHDIDFASTRRNAQMYAVLNYMPPTYEEVRVRTRTKLVEATPPIWTIHALPSITDLPRDVLVRMVGSRKPILFVEGKAGGLDELLYKSAYSDFTVIATGSCAQVIQLVRSFRGQSSLHWLHCAGLVDLDNRTTDEYGAIDDAIYALPVQEVENLLLVSEVFLELAKALSFDADDAARQLERLKIDVLSSAARRADAISLKYTSHRIWEAGKSIGLKAQTIEELAKLHSDITARTDPTAIYNDFRASFEAALTERNYTKILALDDNKNGLLDLLGKSLGLQGRSAIESFITRTLNSPAGAGLVQALRSQLPGIDATAL
ncbi:DUF4435 domain-containing protein [Rhizobium mesosinicum]|uniref:AAA family ATPase n=1 Tax=Rhizobium mesosinicum TaxID=335017 RepID=A0ABS7GN52_9HYPH|nr:DUF4435 domain-containing protein [Rhizobium mesosinicum]MBW9051086.1 AAA family ATPase [Rhizobium mesosinicum]